MSKIVKITGVSPLDASQRAEALQELQNEATTEELLKLKKAIHNPELRGMLKMI